MERGLAEVIVGFRRDPEVGPVVMLGMGGIAAELTKSITVRIAPVTLDTARDDDRRRPRARRAARLSQPAAGATSKRSPPPFAPMSLLALVESRAVTDAEINPLIVKAEGSGVVAVDGLVVFETLTEHSILAQDAPMSAVA